MTYTTKFCKDCKYSSNNLQRCGNPQSIRYVDPISGETMYETTVHMRADKDMCGYEAVFFQSADKQPTFKQKLLRMFK